MITKGVVIKEQFVDETVEKYRYLHEISYYDNLRA